MLPREAAQSLLDAWGYTEDQSAPPTALVQFVGDWNIAAFLCKIVVGLARTSNPEGRFYWGDGAAEGELHLTRQKIRTIREKLEAPQIINHIIRKAEGTPVCHYAADFDKLARLWAEYLETGLPLASNPRLLGKKTNLTARARGKYINSTSGKAELTVLPNPTTRKGYDTEAINSTSGLDQFNQTSKNGGLSVQDNTPGTVSIQPVININKDIRGEEGEAPAAPALLIYREVWGFFPESAKGAAMIVRDVTNLAAWRATLEGWQASGWKAYNIDGMIERYQKKVRSGDYAPTSAAPAPVSSSTPEAEEEDRAGRAKDRSLIYRDSGD